MSSSKDNRGQGGMRGQDGAREQDGKRERIEKRKQNGGRSPSGARRRHKGAWQVRLFFPILWVFSACIVRILFRLHGRGAHVVNGDRRGCVIVANHQSNIDPFVINSLLDRQIQYIVSDSNMRSTTMRMLFWLVGAIPKTKFMHDMRSMRRVVDTVRAGGIVGIFPEGMCSWDGDSTEVVAATTKLIKLLRAPVYGAQVHGTYFALPRWSRRLRRGRTEVRFRLLFSPEEMAALPTREMHQQLQEALQVSAQELQEKRRYRYRGGRAEWCERFLFLCPRCKRVGTLVSKEIAIECKACGPLAILDADYRLRWTEGALASAASKSAKAARGAASKSAKAAGTSAGAASTPEGATNADTEEMPRFDHLTQWNRWQRQYWQERVTQWIGEGSDPHAADEPAARDTQDAQDTQDTPREPATPDTRDTTPRNSSLLPTEQVVIKIGYRQRALAERGTFNLSLTLDGMLHHCPVSPSDGAEIRVPVAEIEGCNVQNGEILEYYHRGTLYQMLIDHRRRNAYKWMLTIQYMNHARQNAPQQARPPA